MSADYQQETYPLSNRGFYYTGFCAGEMSCSLIRASNRGAGFYYTPDFTISNSDPRLLQEVNAVVGQENGIITAITGGYNLSFRGCKKVQIVLAFFDKYPLIVGELANSRIWLLREVVKFLMQRVRNKVYTSEEIKRVETYRAALRRIKQTGNSIRAFERLAVSADALGHFLAGVVDAEGSVSLKRRASTYQPFIALAMKDRQIVELLQDFLGFGNVRRRLDGMYHYEAGCLQDVLAAVRLFTSVYPCQQQRTRARLDKLERILNDYTRDTSTPLYYDGELW